MMYELKCPFCGEYMHQDPTGKSKAVCDKDRVILKSSTTDPNALYIAPMKDAPAYVQNTYKFLRTVRNRDYKLFFSKELPFSERFDLEKVFVYKDEEDMNNSTKEKTTMREEGFVPIALNGIVAHNLNKAFDYAMFSKRGIDVSLCEDSDVYSYVFVQACLDTYYSDAIKDSFNAPEFTARRLPFLEGYLVSSGLVDVGSLPRLSDEALLYSIYIRDMLPSSALVEFDASKNICKKELSDILANADFTPKNPFGSDAFFTLSEKWRDRLIQELCTSNVSTFINYTDNVTPLFSVSNISDISDAVFRAQTDMNVILHQVSNMRVLSYLNEKLFGEYRKYLGYKFKTDYITSKGRSLPSGPYDVVRTFWELVAEEVK